MSDGRDLIGIYGGSFNPPHLGHMRLAVEICEALSPARLDFLPAAVPPHKAAEGLLPFALRVELLLAAVRDLPGVEVNTLEQERPGPSYTIDTLRIYRQREAQSRLFFVLGAEDFAAIRLWREWQILPDLADIVVVPRAGMETETFTRTVRENWPEAKAATLPSSAVNAAFCLPSGGRLLHVPLPRLDIRAELIRERFALGRSIRYLVPDAVEAILSDNPRAVEAWSAQEEPWSN